MAKQIILSFDYELFFGDEPGTVQNSLLGPTEKLLDAIEYAGGHATFFVDYLMLKYLMAECDETREDAYRIIEQLKEIIRRGNRIELHIHPHWVDAKYKNGKWDFSDFSHYCINSFSENDITRMFVEGTQRLEQIAREVIPDYKIIAYRAGGWAVLPFSIMKDGFKSAGIKVDSSIMHGKVINAYGYTLDFTEVPKHNIYRFSDDVKLESGKGEFIEAQICSFKHSVFTTIANILYHRFHPEMFAKLTDGTHTRKNDIKTSAKRLTRWQSLHQIQGFGLSGLPSFLLNYQIIKAKSPVVIISHPKDIMPITCDNLKKLKPFEFITYKDLI